MRTRLRQADKPSTWIGVDSNYEFNAALQRLSSVRTTDTLRCTRNLILPARVKQLKSRGRTLIEALTLFFETASPTEVARRVHYDVFVTQVEVQVG